MEKVGKLEKKEEKAGIWHFTIDGNEYQLDSRSAKFADRIEEEDSITYDAAGSMIKFFKKSGTNPGEKSKDDIVTFKELLNIAHTKDKDYQLIRIETEPVEINWEKKYAVMKAKVLMYDVKNKQNKIFHGTGDSDQDNTGDFVKKAFIRMAETRAIVRALRFALNISKVGEDELGGENNGKGKT